MIKMCFFSPYLKEMHAGGGEKHLFDLALRQGQTKKVLIAITENQQHTLTEYQKFYANFLGKNLDELEFVWTPLFTEASFWKKLFWTRQFDELFYVTDGSLFFSLAKKNTLHVQIPFTQPKTLLLDRIKLKTYDSINTNSEFTKNVIEKSWKIQINEVLHPVIDQGEFHPAKIRKPIILAVGRFFSQLHAKRQDVLISCFSKLIQAHPKKFKNWQLVLIGSVEDKAYFQKIQAQAKGSPVKFITNATRKQVVEYFNTATIFWHAAGFGIDEAKEPEKVEHFGIVTLEALAGGCIPLVVGKGGQREVLGDRFDQLSWQTIDECVSKTIFQIQTKC